jgi:hypothetical protein
MRFPIALYQLANRAQITCGGVAKCNRLPFLTPFPFGNHKLHTTPSMLAIYRWENFILNLHIEAFPTIPLSSRSNLVQWYLYIHLIHHKKSFSIFPSPAGMSLTKLFLGGNNLYMTSLFPPKESLVSDIPAGDGNIEKLFLRCDVQKGM